MDVRVVKEYDPDPHLSLVLPQKSSRYLNLIKNSVQAMAEANMTEKLYIILHTATTGNRAVIEVKGNGPGIPEDIKNNIFDPFFTTRDVETGTARSLSISHAIIIDKNTREIHIESEPGQGTKFIIELPLIQTSHATEHDIPS